MAKYLIQGSYTAEGLRGLHKDKASGRKQAISKAIEALGGKLETIYYSLGEHDVVVIAEAPDLVTAAALGLTVSASGMIRTKTTPLLTVEETDKALGTKIGYRPPGG
jgi:uncharacterized protein with GYD domain